MEEAPGRAPHLQLALWSPYIPSAGGFCGTPINMGGEGAGAFNLGGEGAGAFNSVQSTFSSANSRGGAPISACGTLFNGACAGIAWPQYGGGYLMPADRRVEATECHEIAGRWPEETADAQRTLRGSGRVEATESQLKGREEGQRASGRPKGQRASGPASQPTSQPGPEPARPHGSLYGIK